MYLLISGRASEPAQSAELRITIGHIGEEGKPITIHYSYIRATQKLVHIINLGSQHLVIVSVKNEDCIFCREREG